MSSGICLAYIGAVENMNHRKLIYNQFLLIGLQKIPRLNYRSQNMVLTASKSYVAHPHLVCGILLIHLVLGTLFCFGPVRPIVAREKYGKGGSLCAIQLTE